MGDVGDMYKEWNKLKRIQKNKTRLRNVKALKEHGVTYTEHSSYHFSIPAPKGIISFYPSTSLWFYSNTPHKQHKGVYSLLKHLNRVIL